MKTKNKKIILVLIFIITILSQYTISLANITSGYYKVDNEKNIISRIEPETTVEEFKEKIGDSIIYKDKQKTEEVITGLVGTGMYLEAEDKDYEISVVGDFDGDGKATQVELTNTIRHIVGLQGAELEGIKYESADLTGDGLVDQRDITKYIRYIVFGELDLGKVDTTEPEVSLRLTNKTSSTIKVEASAIDKESGMGENTEFIFYIKKKNDTEYKEVQRGTKSTLEITELEQDTEYEIKVETQDKAGNKGQAEIEVKTEKIPDGTEAGAITFGETKWENNMAKTTISTNTQYDIEYQVNGTNGKWIQGEYVTGLKHGDVLYARLTDGTNSGTFIFKNIIDDVEPEITMNVIVDDVNLKATATVTNVKENESGIDENAVYTFYIKTSNEPDTGYAKIQESENTSCDFTSLTPNTKYTIKVEVEDKAGNVGKAEQEIEIQGQQVPDATESGAIAFGEVQWSNGQAQIQINTNTEYIIEYQVNGTTEGNWTKGSVAGQSVTVTNLNHNDIVYARLTDGTKHGNHASVTIIDKIAPMLDITTTSGTSQITATVTAADNETGIDTNETYIYYIKEAGEPDSSYEEKQKTTDTTYTFTGLDQNKDYTIKVEIKDKAGNIGTKETSETTQRIPDATEAGSIIFSNITWINGQAEVEISTNTNYQIEYQVNGTTNTWTQVPEGTTQTTVTGLNHNDVIYARLTDGTTGGDYTTLTIVDTIKPNIILNLQSENQEIKATVDATDYQTGIDVNETYKFSIKETGAEDSAYIETQNTTSNTCNFTGLTVGKNYTVKVEVADKAGNVGIIEKSILIPDDVAPIVTLTTIARSSSTVTVEAGATDDGGLPDPVIYVFYIKETGAPDSTYVEIANRSMNQCTFRGLEQDKDYTVKVEVADIAGNVGKKELSILTAKIPDATEAGAISFNLIKWTNGQAEVEISTNTNYQMEYQVNGTSSNWTQIPAGTKQTTVTGLNHNDVIYARLTDGTNSSNPATLTVIDATKPTVTLNATSNKSSEIIATADAIDNETGIDENATYTFYIKEQGGTYTQKQNTTSKTCVFTGLDQNKDYTIKVEVKDKAGNTGIKETSIKTKSIPDATTAGAIVFSSITWNNGQAEVTISTNTDYYIEYQVNGTQNIWTKGNVAGESVTVTGLKHNDIIYARLTDGVNGGQYATLTVIDTVKPQDFTISVTDVTTTGFTITGSTTDKETGIRDYTYVIESSGNEIKYENITDTSYTVTGLMPETRYSVYMIAYDNAGNERKSAVKTAETKTIEIQVSDIIIAETTTATESVEDYTIVKGTPLYINFSATIEGIPCTIVNKEDGKEVPYEIETNGTYTFTITGTYGGKTKTKEVVVEVKKYRIYEIWTPDDLQNMGNDLSGTYYVMQDIDMSGYDFKTIELWNGNSIIPFTGTLDGQGYTISNLTIINTKEGYGKDTKASIFRRIQGATIKNLLLKDVNISCATDSVGVFTDMIEYSNSTNSIKTTFEKVGITGNLTGTNNVGSFVGSGDAIYENCYARTTLSSTHGWGTGGFCGRSGGGVTATNCYWSGTMTARQGVGTFMANSNSGNSTVMTKVILSNCYYNNNLFTLTVPEKCSGTGLTIEQFSNRSNFEGWDFTNDWYIGPDGYPELKF